MRGLILLLLVVGSCDPDRRWDGIHDMETQYEQELRHRVDRLETQHVRVVTEINTLSICLDTHLSTDMRDSDIVMTVQDCIARTRDPNWPIQSIR